MDFFALIVLCFLGDGTTMYPSAYFCINYSIFVTFFGDLCVSVIDFDL